MDKLDFLTDEAIDILVEKSLKFDKLLYYTDVEDLQRNLQVSDEDYPLLFDLDLVYINIVGEDIYRNRKL